MAVTFYDIAIEEDPNDPGWFDIERIYCFDWDRFSDKEWQSLHEVYAALPEWCFSARNECPRWFADHDDPDNGYLTASVEPPGLQVFGTLPQSKWAEWDEQFQKLAESLPIRSLSSDPPP